MPEHDDADAAVAELRLHCGTFDLELPASAAASLQSYIRLLLHWNQRISLTGARTARELALAHILDCLHVAPLLIAGEATADIGSGAGFPGIPLATARPDCSFTLIEARRKRASFLRYAVATLRLANVQVVEARAQELAVRCAETFDVAVVRAVTDLASACRMALPLLRPPGRIIAMKGPKPEPEVRQLPDALELVATHWYRLPDPWGERTLVVVRRRRHDCFT